MTEYRLRIIKNILMIGAVILLVSVLVLVPNAEYGWWIYFASSLAGGLGIAILNFVITYKVTESASQNSNYGIIYVVPFIKMMLYALAMFTAVALFGLPGVIGAGAGCLAGPVAIMSKYPVDAARRKLRAAIGLPPANSDEDAEEREYIYESCIRAADGTLRHIIIKCPYMEIFSGGRSYVTHRRFKKLREIRIKKPREEIRGVAEV